MANGVPRSGGNREPRNGFEIRGRTAGRRPGSRIERPAPLKTAACAGFGRDTWPMEKGQNMKSASSLDPEESDGEVLGNPSRGSTHAMWTQRRQAKQRTRVRAKRRGASMAAQKGMHLRRNKRVSW